MRIEMIEFLEYRSTCRDELMCVRSGVHSVYVVLCSDLVVSGAEFWVYCVHHCDYDGETDSNDWISISSSSIEYLELTKDLAQGVPRFIQPTSFSEMRLCCCCSMDTKLMFFLFFWKMLLGWINWLEVFVRGLNFVVK